MLQATASTTRKWDPISCALFRITRPAFSSFMSDCIQLKSVPISGQSAPLHFCLEVRAVVHFCSEGYCLWCLLVCCLVQTLFEGHSLRDTYKHCDLLQSVPTGPQQEGAAALTFTHASICHQGETWEAGAASPACHRRTLLTAKAIFCKRQKYKKYDH